MLSVNNNIVIVVGLQKITRRPNWASLPRSQDTLNRLDN